MKRLFILGVVCLFFAQSQAHEPTTEVLLHQLINYDVALRDVTAQGIDWKIGDQTVYSLKMLFGQGLMDKEVTKDEGTAFWLTSNVDLMGQKQKIEALIRKADGKTLKLLVNGQEQEIPEPDFEIIEQKEAHIKVSKFPNGIDCIYLKIKDRKKGDEIETWINPQAVPIDGMLKTIAKQGFMPITLELKDFKRSPHEVSQEKTN